LLVSADCQAARGERHVVAVDVDLRAGVRGGRRGRGRAGADCAALGRDVRARRGERALEVHGAQITKQEGVQNGAHRGRHRAGDAGVFQLAVQRTVTAASHARGVAGRGEQPPTNKPSIWLVVVLVVGWLVVWLVVDLTGWLVGASNDVRRILVTNLAPAILPLRPSQP
jgi:hypothetical protein